MCALSVAEFVIRGTSHHSHSSGYCYGSCRFCYVLSVCQDPPKRHPFHSCSAPALIFVVVLMKNQNKSAIAFTTRQYSPIFFRTFMIESEMTALYGFPLLHHLRSCADACCQDFSTSEDSMRSRLRLTASGE